MKNKIETRGRKKAEFLGLPYYINLEEIKTELKKLESKEIFRLYFESYGYGFEMSNDLENIWYKGRIRKGGIQEFSGNPPSVLITFNAKTKTFDTDEVKMFFKAANNVLLEEAMKQKLKEVSDE